jgi:hypothetical protein
VFIRFLVLTHGGGATAARAEITDFIGGDARFFDGGFAVDSVYVA